MKNEFIPYEQALELRELGFLQDDTTWRCVQNEGCEDEKLGWGILYQQAFRWFREKYGYNCFITSSVIDGKWYYFRENLNNRKDDSEPELTQKFNTYEEAELACLIKLIEIVKGKDAAINCHTFS